MTVNTGTLTTELIDLLERLEENGIAYRLEHNRPESVTVVVSVPGEIWEIEFLRDGDIEIEKFISDGSIHREEAIEVLLNQHGNGTA